MLRGLRFNSLSGCRAWVEAVEIVFRNVLLAYGVGIKVGLGPVRRTYKPPGGRLALRAFVCGRKAGRIVLCCIRLKGRGAVFAKLEVILVVGAANLTSHIQTS